jgi:hypothetical protein
MTNRVSSELAREILNAIAEGNGLRATEIKDIVHCAPSAVAAGLKVLLDYNCISKGAVKYFRKDGEETLHTGYFYEQDLPATYKTPRKRQERK